METENLPNSDAPANAEATSGSAPPGAERSAPSSEAAVSPTSEATLSPAASGADPFAPTHELNGASETPLATDPFAPPRDWADAATPADATSSQTPFGAEPAAAPQASIAGDSSLGTREWAQTSSEAEGFEEEPAPMQSWMRFLPTVLVGILMFVLGGVGGFVGRPYVMPSPTPTAAPTSAPQQAPDMQAILAQLISKTRHWKGNANAPVTMIEFSDFQ